VNDTTQPQPATRLMTRDQLLVYLREECGYPIGASTFDKLCASAVNEGPPVDRYWGRRPLYNPVAGLAWAEARCKRQKSNAS
jgi:hypothetical protein